MFCNNLLTRLVFIMLVAVGFMLTPHDCAAQAVPDTSLNNIIQDTLHERKPDTTVHPLMPPAPATASDTVAIKNGPFQPNPKKSGLYSALVPGLGQLYNRQYWKVPLIYGGVAVAGYFFIDNLKQYQDYRKAYISRVNNPYPTDKYVNVYTTDQLNQLQNDYNRYLDLTALLSGIGYVIQVIDAVTSAHLKNFDISRDISMHIAPVATPYGVGLGLVMNLK